MIKAFSRYWHTLRYLRPVQLYGRLWFRLYRPTPDLRPAPGLRLVAGHWERPPARQDRMLGPATFRFLNETHEAIGPGAWNDPARDKLWLYNLHYFDALGAGGDVGPRLRAQWHRALLRRWMAENPPAVGNGWEPYPTSLRIVNWVKWALAGNDLPPECVSSLAVQARWLSRRLEHHLLGNHLFANAKALVYAGAFFVGAQADRWLALGRRLLARELREQVLADGGHFERSPMYHAILLEDVLDLINLAGTFPGSLAPDDLALCREKAAAMLGWLAVMCHPDGGIGFFNDAALGSAPTLGALIDYAQRLGLPVGAPVGADVVGGEGAGPASSPFLALGPGLAALDGSPEYAALPTLALSHGEVQGLSSVWLRDSGYVRLEAGSAVALLDVAPIGPDYLPGHAHADTLSFELSLCGRRVIVNGGTSRYGTGPERLAERGTAAHSTVQIDHADSSDVWGGFRVARRARPFALCVGFGPASSCTVPGGMPVIPAQRVAAAHDGYRRLPGRPIHRRTWEMTPGCLVVTDAVSGAHGEAVARFHLHPEMSAEVETVGAGGRGLLHLPGGQVVRWSVTGGQARLVPSVWHPEFGRSLPTRCLEIRIVGGESRAVFDWGCGEDA